MTLRARIFASTLSLSILLLGAAAAGVSHLSSRQVDDDLAASAEAIERLSRLANEASVMSGAPSLGESFTEALSPLRKDLARRMVLERDVGLNLAIAWIGFFAIEAVVALIVALVASRYLTARWSRLRDGMMALRHGDMPGPFFGGTVDEFGAVEEELDGLVAALADRERARSELRALQGWGEASAFLAHQARTPLASLSLSARTARAALERASAADSDAIVTASLERIESEAARIASLFSRVRSMSGFKDLEPEELDPAEAFREAVATLAARGYGEALDPSRTVIASGGDGPLPLLDRAYLVEAFVNLVSNSLEACAERGIDFGSSLDIERSGKEITLRYSDSVTGLEPELAAKVGTARFSTKPGGSGLGVWLVSRIAALHGGSLSVGLGERGGLVFTLVFPVERAIRG